jgi:hypothetical protein
MNHVTSGLHELMFGASPFCERDMFSMAPSNPSFGWPSIGFAAPHGIRRSPTSTVPSTLRKEHQAENEAFLEKKRRERLERTLEQLDEVARTGLDKLPELLKWIDHADPHVAEAAKKAIQKLSKDTERAVPCLLETARKLTRSRAHRLIDLAKLDGNAAPDLIRHLETDEKEIAVYTLTRIGEPALPALVSALGRCDRDGAHRLRVRPAVSSDATTHERRRTLLCGVDARTHRPRRCARSP